MMAAGKTRPKVAVLHTHIENESKPDDLDVLVQVDAVAESLRLLGYDPVPVALSLNLQTAVDALTALRPRFVFNLVESIGGTGRFLHFAAVLLDHLKIPYTGSSTDALYVTTNKLLAKQRLQVLGIATPQWFTLDLIDDTPLPCIIKPIWEDASLGISGASVLHSGDRYHMSFVSTPDQEVCSEHHNEPVHWMNCPVK